MSNQLASEPSAYLKSAAHQPVHWLPWGEAAFARARAEDKPVLLDIGAVWCHWCHVMDGESYEDEEIAKVLNRDFVCVKVDRDERPDVDARYQRAVQALSGQGGWPLTAFLTPAGEVFFGGTYFPPENNHYGRPGFRSVLLQVARAFREDKARINTNAEAIRQHVTDSLDEAKAGAVTPALLEHGADQMARMFDIRYGGFGSAPKFPHPGACEFLLARWHDTRLDWQRDVVEKTLTAMARGEGFLHDIPLPVEPRVVPACQEELAGAGVGELGRRAEAAIADIEHPGHLVGAVLQEGGGYRSRLRFVQGVRDVLSDGLGVGVDSRFVLAKGARDLEEDRPKPGAAVVIVLGREIGATEK